MLLPQRVVLHIRLVCQGPQESGIEENRLLNNRHASSNNELERSRSLSQTQRAIEQS